MQMHRRRGFCFFIRSSPASANVATGAGDPYLADVATGTGGPLSTCGVRNGKRGWEPVLVTEFLHSFSEDYR